MNRGKIVRLTEDYGGEWAIHHARRLVRIISIIGEGSTYNTDITWIAAHLHDWGACPKWVKPGMNHSKRSRQIAEKFLIENHCPKEWQPKILEAIEFHHGGADERPCIEAVLLADADALDGIGVLGVLKEFAQLPVEVRGDYCMPIGIGLRGAYERARIRQENNPTMLKLESSRTFARKRLEDMDKLFGTLEDESFGFF